MRAPAHQVSSLADVASIASSLDGTHLCHIKRGRCMTRAQQANHSSTAKSGRSHSASLHFCAMQPVQNPAGGSQVTTCLLRTCLHLGRVAAAWGSMKDASADGLLTPYHLRNSQIIWPMHWDIDSDCQVELEATQAALVRAATTLAKALLSSDGANLDGSISWSSSTASHLMWR